MAVHVAGPDSGVTVLTALDAKTATNLHQITPPLWAKGMLLILNVTLDAASAIITLTLEVGDALGNYDEVGWSAAATVAAVGDFSYLFYPTGQLTANKEYDGTESVNAPIPREFQISLTHTDADAITYSAMIHWRVILTHYVL